MAVFVVENDRVLGDNMVDSTLGFAQQIADPPPGVELTDEYVQQQLALVLTQVGPEVQLAVTRAGLTYTGPREHPVIEDVRETLRTESVPVTVKIDMPNVPEGRA